MIFKSATPAMAIYFFDRNKLTLTQSKITSVVPSHVDMKVATGRMVVDITANIDNRQQTYTIDDSLSIAYFGNIAVSIDMDVILQEIENMKNNSEQIINDVPHHKEIIEKCSEILLNNNPKLKEKKAIDDRFSAIDDKMDKLMQMMAEFVK